MHLKLPNWLVQLRMSWNSHSVDISHINETVLSAFQHFPMYRKSDANCTGSDAAPENERSKPWREKMDTLSKDASKKVKFFRLLDWKRSGLVESFRFHGWWCCVMDTTVLRLHWRDPSPLSYSKNRPTLTLTRVLVWCLIILTDLRVSWATEKR